eukprot:scaffold25306_cov63-Phaeocystis_antarctica.AAC.1
MAGQRGPSGRLAEAGRSSGQPEARSGAEGGLRRASRPRSEPPCFPHRRDQGRVGVQDDALRRGQRGRDPVRLEPLQVHRRERPALQLRDGREPRLRHRAGRRLRLDGHRQADALLHGRPGNQTPTNPK